MSKHSGQPNKPNKPTMRKQRQTDFATIGAALGALAVIIPLLIFSSIIIFFQVYQMNLPGVFIFDHDVGLKNKEETEQLVDKIWNQDRKIQVLSSEDPGFSHWVSPQDLGIWVDPRATALAAYNIGRASEPLSDVISAVSGEPQVIIPVLYYNNDNARQSLEQFAEELSIPSQNASIAYQDNDWVSLPGREGIALDVETAQSIIFENAFTILLTQTFTLPMNPVSPDVIDLTPILSEIETVIQADLRLEAYDPITNENFAWAVPVDVKRSWVDVDPETYQISLLHDTENIVRFINARQEELGEGRYFVTPAETEELVELWENEAVISLPIRHKPTTYQVGGGESLWGISLWLGMPMWNILNANEGLTTGNLEAGMTLIIPSKNDLLPLPAIPNKRIVIDISAQRMTVYENGNVRNTLIVSTGVPDSPTMAGIFQVQTHEINAYASNWDLYMPHFIGIYEAWPGFMNGIHGLPLLSNGQRLWAGNLGTPVSYGCIVLDLPAAEDLYHWAEPGVVVEITQ